MRSHFTSLKRDHDLPVTRGPDGLYRFDRRHLGIESAPRPISALSTGKGSVPAPVPVVEVSAAEGRELLRLHRLRERSRALIARKKREVLSEPTISVLRPVSW